MWPLLPLIGKVASWAAPFIQSGIENRMNRKMSEYSYSKDLDMWNRQNEYNSPKMQMQRFGQAGLNPNLIYDKVNSTPATMPKYNPPQQKFNVPDPMAILNSFQDFALKSKQLDLLKQQIDLTGQKNTNEDIKNGLLNLSLNLKDPIAFKKAMANGWGDILPSDSKSMSEYQLQGLQLGNQKRENEIANLFEKVGISQSQKQWLQMKLENMQKTGVNIDKDQILYRLLSDMFGDKVLQFKNFVKTKPF